MRILILLLSLPAILAAAKLPSIPDMLPKPVEFTVLDPEGQPVVGALVEASRAGPGNSTGLTDGSGRLNLLLNSGSTLYVHVSKDGYYTTSGELWTGGIHKGPN
ncbi:MAG TPA: carboxypeptidase-like regulatory domain-containing protein, partial [Oceanipulchritudo sp.]|nr:carboxypeptidase-like regulatory domain-containing protein [Oceanipulchritudo sp.]